MRYATSVQVSDGSATVTTTANAVVLSAQTGLTSFTSTVLEARTTAAPVGAFYLFKVVCGCCSAMCACERGGAVVSEVSALRCGVCR